jgi:hypothetical protein
MCFVVNGLSGMMRLSLLFCQDSVDCHNSVSIDIQSLYDTVDVSHCDTR